MCAWPLHHRQASSLSGTVCLAPFPQVLEDDVVALMRKRVYDVAGVLGKGVKVGATCGSGQHAPCRRGASGS